LEAAAADRTVARADAVQARLEQVGRALECLVVWARLLDSHRGFPFGDLHLTRAQLEALFYIAHSARPATPTVLAKALGVTGGAVTQLVAGLIAAGLVVQERDPTDGRRRALVLSPDSGARVAGFERDLSLSMTNRFSPLTDDELETMVRLLSKTTEMT
jgi:DNA-binding MarR family transcriptional regulator